MQIACEVAGSGPPIVMVHGAGSARWSFDLVVPHLAETFTLWRVDRRGRGDSGDGPPGDYSVESEFEDMAAVVRAAGPGALLFGHSYGGLVAAGAAARVNGLPRLALYEGPMGGVLADEAWTARFEADLAAGDRAAAVRDFMGDIGGYSEAEIAAMQDTSVWAARLEVSPTVPRELHAERALSTGDLRLGELTVPVLLLVGSESPAWARRSTDAFAAALPDAAVHVLEGHGHGAATSAPELLAGELRSFFA